MSVEETRSRLEELTTRAAAKDAIKDFNAAAELYSEATELQAELNGELSLDNSDLLYSYGKALYNVAVSKSDVLGSKVAGEPSTQSGNGPAPNITSAEQTAAGDSLVQNAIASGMAKKGAEENVKSQSEKKEGKPFFQFTGDENFDDSDSENEDENDGDGGEEEGEEEDDFANAFEVLDLARILYHKRLEAAEENSGKGKSAGLPSDVKHIKERLADTYDLQAEISLEAERFGDAVTDLRTALDLRLSLFAAEDPAVAECHYKLSLALEFSSVNKPSEEDDGDRDEQKDAVDNEMRKEAATQMEKAIESCQLRMAQEQKKLDDDKSIDEDKAISMRRKIANVKDIIADMEQRLIDLRRPPVSMKEEQEQEQKSEAVLKGILGQIVGQTPVEQKAKIDAATKNANDLSAFVRRKPAASQSSRQAESASKRPAEEGDEESDAKRTRVDGGGNSNS